MHPIKLVLLVLFINLCITLSASTDYQSQYNITNQWISFQESTGEKSLTINEEAKEGDIIQKGVNGALSLAEAVLVIPKFVIFFAGLLLTPIFVPFAYAQNATNANEQLFYGIIGLITTTLNILMVYTFYKIIVNKGE